MEKRLVKGTKKICGVCSGIANYFNCDPTLIRLAFVALVLFYGVGALGYLVAALVMPSE